MRTRTRFTVPGPPVPKARPRFGRGRAYTPETTVRYERTVKLCALAAGVRPLVGPVHLEVVFYVRDARARDGDNLQKAIQDALNGVAYADDSQVRSWAGRLEVDKAQPRAEVTVETLESSL